jgi:S1-C subfamily serine protease
MTVKKILIIFCTVFFSTTVSAQEQSLDNLEAGLNELIYNLSRSVVTIEASSPVYTKSRSGIDNEALHSTVSTGIIYDTVGHIIALASSVIDRNSITVKFDNQSTKAFLKAVDYQSGLALLQAVTPVGIPIKLSKLSGCAGQMIVALGNAYGLRVSPSLGFCAGYRTDGLMQFSALFTSGTSGGGLFTLSGELAGIITGRLGGNNTDMGLAISSRDIKESINYLKYRGNREAGYLGLSSTEIEIIPPLEVVLPIKMAGSRSINKIQISHGLIIDNVVAGSPADIGGIKSGDLIFQINGRKIFSAQELESKIKRTTPGNLINLSFVRDNNSYSTSVKVGKINKMSSIFTNESDFSVSSNDLLTDSILKEISKLRNRIKQLEDRLNQVR